MLTEAMIDGLNGKEWTWEQSKHEAMEFLVEHVGELEKATEAHVVYAIKNNLMMMQAMQSIINDNITDTHMPEGSPFRAVTELKAAMGVS
jgi:uncharacterized protein YutE (UPF0331/DUF86 family)